jgi:hypothetical protein
LPFYLALARRELAITRRRGNLPADRLAALEHVLADVGRAG